MRKSTLHGCSYSNLLVYPKNWKTTTLKKSLNDIWVVKCRFYDPQHRKKYPNGFQFARRVNDLDTLEQRKEAIEKLLKEIPYLFEERGFNPITGRYMTLIDSNSRSIINLSPNIHFIDALRFALERRQISEPHRKQITWCLNRVEKYAGKLMIALPVGQIQRKHIKALLEYGNLSPNVYNKFKSYLSPLFEELIELEVIEINPVEKIRKLSIPIKVRETLTFDEFQAIKSYLKIKCPDFFRYMMIFLFSGSRSSELMSLQKKNVSLSDQEYTVTIKKGRFHKTVKKVILQEALPYWQEIIDLCRGDNDYLFSTGLIPGPKANNENQITRRWKRHIKDANKNKIQLKYDDGRPLYVSADFYSLKHIFLDSLPANVAKEMAAHTTLKTTRIYRVNQEARDREALKKIHTNFSKRNEVGLELFNDINWN